MMYRFVFVVAICVFAVALAIPASAESVVADNSPPGAICTNTIVNALLPGAVHLVAENTANYDVLAVPAPGFNDDAATSAVAEEYITTANEASAEYNGEAMAVATRYNIEAGAVINYRKTNEQDFAQNSFGEDLNGGTARALT